MVKYGNFAELIKKLVNVGIVEFVHDKTKDIIGLFGMSKDVGSKQRLILDAR